MVMKYRLLPAGAFMPGGWPAQQMRDDLHSGIAGDFPSFMGEVRHARFVHHDCPAGATGWWTGEQEGYWLDGLVRTAYLTRDIAHELEARQAIDAIVTAQSADPTGYIGIYPPDRRYPAQGPDGDLWAKSRLFQAMFALGDFTGDRTYLQAVKRAVALDMSIYSRRDYFDRAKGDEDGGVSHAVGYFDTLDELYRRTNDRRYMDFAAHFYSDMSNWYARHPDKLGDLVPVNLSDPKRVLKNHAPHVAEGWYVPAMIAAATGDASLSQADRSGWIKLQKHLAPGGALVGDETVRGRFGNGDASHEYCAMTELLGSLCREVQYDGNLPAIDAAERVALNDSQGARLHPAAVALEYLSTDNRRDIDESNERRIYKPVHLAAACCALNIPRTMPYYLQGAWMSLADRPGLAAMIYAPGTLSADVGGLPIHIDEQTNYPFDDNVTLTIHTVKAMSFELRCRVPYADSTTVDVDRVDVLLPDLSNRQQIVFNRQWHDGDRIHLHFNFTTELVSTPDGQIFLRRGPLVFALPFAAEISQVNRRMLPGLPSSKFYDLRISPSGDTSGWYLTMNPHAPPPRIENLADGDPLHPWVHPSVGLLGNFKGPAGKEVQQMLIPMGCTILRRVTFAVSGY